MGRVELAPPSPRLFGDEVRKRGVARPDLAKVEIAAFGAAEHIPFDGLIEYPVARIELHSRVDDRDHPEALLIEVVSASRADRGTDRCPR